LYALAPVTAGQLTVSDVAAMFENVGTPGAPAVVRTLDAAE
jgi:hypothetical protein